MIFHITAYRSYSPPPFAQPRKRKLVFVRRLIRSVREDFWKGLRVFCSACVLGLLIGATCKGARQGFSFFWAAQTKVGYKHPRKKRRSSLPGVMRRPSVSGTMDMSVGSTVSAIRCLLSLGGLRSNSKSFLKGVTGKRYSEDSSRDLLFFIMIFQNWVTSTGLSVLVGLGRPGDLSSAAHTREHFWFYIKNSGWKTQVERLNLGYWRV